MKDSSLSSLSTPLSSKTVLKLDLHDDNDKRKALKAVSTFSGIDSISMDMKERKMTVVGTVDPIDIVKKLRKSWKAEIFSVGAPQKEGGGGGGGGGGSGGGGGGGGGEKKNNPNPEQMAEFLRAYQAYHYPPYIPNQYYYAQSIDENPPNTCVIM